MQAVHRTIHRRDSRKNRLDEQIFIVADIWDCYNMDIKSDKFESVNNFQTASLHGNDKQTILKVGGGTNGK